MSMYLREHRRAQSGLSLVEAILYIFLTSVLVVMLFSVSTGILVSRARAETFEEISYTASRLAHQITMRVRESETVTIINPGLSGEPELQIEYADADTLTTAVYLRDGAVYEREEGLSPVRISGERVVVELMDVELVAGEVSDAVTVRFSIGLPRTEVGGSRNMGTFDFWVTATTRI